MKVKFLPQGIELEIQPNQTVMDLAHRNGIFIKSICNGVPNCAECRVKLVEGEYNVLPPSSKELSLIGSGHFIDQRRLSCQLYCFGDITVDLTEQEKKEHEGPPGSRRFQVDLRNEGVVSKAVTGNLIQQDGDIVQAITDDLAHSNGPAVGKKGAKFR
ncbi:MAG: 2Fe-2S iron-sulfur cluster binding domain-containing protein [Bdellovibrionales bacterium]|nr:2Fe-2S iron-sulfur cluster binding domain-containing protein [Bdellovibrionales bacterium]